MTADPRQLVMFPDPRTPLRSDRERARLDARMAAQQALLKTGRLSPAQVDHLDAYEALTSLPRLDAAIHNIYTGSGIVDSSTGTVIRPERRLAEYEIQALLLDTYLGRTISFRPIRDALQRWPILKFGVDDPNAADVQKLQTQASDVMDQVEAMGRDLIVKAGAFARAFGGAIIYAGIADGRAPDQPVDEERISEVTHFTIFQPSEVMVVGIENDPLAPRYREHSHYQIQRQLASPSHRFGLGASRINTVIHASRCVQFRGAPTTVERYEYNQYWDDSVFQAMTDVLKRCGIGWQTASNLLNKASLMVMRQKGYRQMIAGKASGGTSLATQLVALRQSMSVAGALHMDVEDEIENISVQMTGVPDMIDRLCSEASAATGMPVTILWGVSPGGQNATGDSDWANYMQFLTSVAEWDLNRPILRLAELIMRSRKGPLKGKLPRRWWLEFLSPRKPTEREDAEIRKLDSETFKNLIDSEVATPAEVAVSAFGEQGYSRDIKVDQESRETQLELDAGQMDLLAEQGPQLPPAPPGMGDDETDNADDDNEPDDEADDSEA